MKALKKFRYFSILCLALVLFACEEDNNMSNRDDETGNVLRVKINGDLFETRDGIVLLNPLVEGIEQLQIQSGVSETPGGKFGAGVLIITRFDRDIADISPNTHDSSATCDINDGDICSGVNFFGGTIDNDFFNGLEQIVESESTVTFTTIQLQSGERVKGTFSARILADDGDEVELTEGEFDMIMP